MARLIAKSPLAGVLPLAAPGLALSEPDLGRITSLAPYNGREKDVDEVLKSALGLGFPKPNATLSADGARIIWSGRGQALLLGAEVPGALAGLAAITDQSDAWAALRIEGAKAEAALARLVPLHLRAAVFPEGATARTFLFHMTCSITRVGAEAFEILVLRSFGRTAAHDLHVAMKSVAAQA